MVKPRKRRAAGASSTAAPSVEKRSTFAQGLLSPEQSSIVHDLCARKNVLAVAKAGSGKSSVALAAARDFHTQHNLRSLIITYNSRLKQETRARITEMGLEDCAEAHSYHAVAARYFVRGNTRLGATDELIHHAMSLPATQELTFGLIVIDEAQDMKPLYARFVVHLLRHLVAPPTLLVVGDPFQRIFGFSGATCLYLQNPEQHFGAYLHHPTFETHHLSICWRITHEMAAWINDNLNPAELRHCVSPSWWAEHGPQIQAWWGEGIHANPALPLRPASVRLYQGWGSRDAAEHVAQLFRKYGNNGVALLAYSLKGRNPVQKLVDRLGSQDNENWVVLNNSVREGELFQNKRVASTIHCFKGLERDAVLVCGLTSFLEKRGAVNPLDHFNVWYVACTRARKELVINIPHKSDMYVTLRKAMLTTESKVMRKECQVKGLVQYVPFDEVLSVQDRFIASGMQGELKHAAMAVPKGMVPGREPGTVESLQPFFNMAVMTHLVYRLQGSVPPLPPVTSRDEDYFDRDMLDWVATFCQRPTADWGAIIRYAVAAETRGTRYKHYWRQLNAIPESEIPVDFLQRCSDNALTLLTAQARDGNPRAHVEFHVPVSIYLPFSWFQQKYHNPICGFVDMYINKNQIVTLHVGDSVDADCMLRTQLYASIARHRGYVLLANRGQLHALKLTLEPTSPNVHFDLVYRTVRRKLQLPITPDIIRQDYQVFAQHNNITT